VENVIRRGFLSASGESDNFALVRLPAEGKQHTIRDIVVLVKG